MTVPGNGESESRRRVGVVGAGIAGLATAKVLREDGFEVIVFERAETIGGVWAASRTYPGLRANNSRETYAFSDHPYESAANHYPDAEQIRGYLDSYARRFGLESAIRLSTEVVRVGRAGTGFTVETRGPDGNGSVACDFVVVCAGTFSVPNAPEIAGADRFEGTAVHSSAATAPELFTGQRVVVVGAGKSALDCAAWAADRARESTLVFRQPHWMAPRFLPGGVPSDRVLINRPTELLFRYHRLSKAERVLHGPGRWLPAALMWAMGNVFRITQRVPAIMVPARPLPVGFENIGMASEFFAAVRTGRITLRRDVIAEFTGPHELRLGGGERVGADVVVFGTGWRTQLPFLAPELAAEVLRDGRFHLYRHILPPDVPGLGFVGYASSVACQLSSEISAHWLSQHFRGELELPEAEAMRAEIARVHAWVERELPARREGFFVGPHLLHHIDDLMTDMRLPVRRSRTAFAEYAGKFSPARYRDVAAERARARTGHAIAP
ncbi:flavin-containing monooxygenase [Nocardia aurantia]|uniref:Ferredoxin--NADP reductase n=1 Tax=Nocardia aurantia TaxID=2585199 RepID=A0A7K0DSZ2_9NOCA|nr:NAD(P)/FAD-dependent oxidoreductase [Nocardia aurantia]MQY28846.1 Ferredoxin--NADP reductase [Nocardia aurantia]